MEISCYTLLSRYNEFFIPKPDHHVWQCTINKGFQFFIFVSRAMNDKNIKNNDRDL